MLRSLLKFKKSHDNKQIITNSVSLVLFYTQKEPYRSFDGLDDPAIHTTKRYGDLDTQAQTVFREECGALVIFDPSRFERMDRESVLSFPPEVYGVTEGLVEILRRFVGKDLLVPGM